MFYAGLGFDRTAPPNTVAVNKGTFDGSGNLTWSAPTFINQTTSPSTLNHQEWIAAGSDDVYHALWTDSNNVQNVTWFYGFEVVPTPIHQQDVATAKGKF